MSLHVTLYLLLLAAILAARGGGKDFGGDAVMSAGGSRLDESFVVDGSPGRDSAEGGLAMDDSSDAGGWGESDGTGADGDATSGDSGGARAA